MTGPVLLTPAPEDAGARIDAYLAASLDGVSRSAAQRLIEMGAVTVDGGRVAKNYRLTGREHALAVRSPPQWTPDRYGNQERWCR